MEALTIDFHNTLFRCDEWFELEVNDLPVAFLRHTEQIDGNIASNEMADRVTATYRDLRRSVINSGNECDAVTSVISVLEELDLPQHAADVERGVREIMLRAMNRARPLPGASELVREAHEAGTRLAVVSSACYHPFLEWCLERFGIRTQFDVVISSASCGIYKSNPDIYQHALQTLDVVPARSVHLGDSHRYDVNSASKVGMRTVLLTSNANEALDPAPDLVIDSLHGAFPRMMGLFDTIPTN